MKLLLPCWLVLCCLACNQKASEKQEKEDAAQPVPVFPVSSFFTEQIKNVESFGLPTVKYINRGNRTDTVSIEMDEFKLLAREFIDADISSPAISGNYKESNFADQSIPSVTFTYSTSNSTLPVQRLDVIVEPSATGEDKVKTIYIEKKQLVNDTVILKKLYWRADKNYQVITSKQIGNSPEIISQVKVAWDNSDGY